MEHSHKQLHEWDAEIDRRVEELRLCRVSRNMAAPVNLRLPAELLCEIFMAYQSVECADAATPNYSWFSISHVCHYWRKILLEFPHFWRRIFLTECTRLECVEQLLVRSANIPLIVNAKFRGYRINAPKPFEYILERLPLISTLCIRSYPDIVPDVIRILKADAPELVSLTFAPFSEYTHAWVDIPIPALQNVPKLTSLELMHCTATFARCQHLFTSSLRELIIRLREVPQQNELQAALSTLPHLEMLHIITPPVTRPKSVFAKRPTFMSRLRIAKFVGSTWTCAYFLNSISLPINASIHVEIDPDEASRHINMDYTVLGSAFKDKLYGERKDSKWPLAPLGIHTERAKIILSWCREFDPLSLSARKFHGAVVTVTMSAVTRYLEAFCTTCDMSKIRVLAIGSLDSIVGQPWAGALSQFSNVEDLTAIDTQPTALASMCDVLEYRVGQLAPTLLFPKLEAVFLSSVTFLPGGGLRTRLGPATQRPYVSDDKASLEWQSFKTSLRVRAANDMPVTSVVLAKVEGLLPESVPGLKGLVKSVRLDERTVEFDVPIMSGTEVLERYGTVGGESDTEAQRDDDPPFILGVEWTADEDEDDDDEDDDEVFLD